MAALPLYIPKDQDDVPEKLIKGSAILRVGAYLRVAAKRFRHESFGDVCRLAAQQGAALDPRTVELVEVGWFDEFEGVVKLRPGRDRTLARWIGTVPYRNDLEASDSRHRKRQQARPELRRAYMQGNMAKVERLMREHNLRHW